jgi:glutamate-1-semialdehyde 2,1-aminomutase
VRHLRAVDLDHALGAARHRYVDRRPQSAEWHERAVSVLPGGNTRSVLHFDPFPFRVAQAHGSRLVDVDGHEYVDLLGNYTAGLLGHSPSAVRDAAHRAIDNGWALGAVHANEVRLAELVTGRFASIERVRFTNSGTEANLMALALACHATGRSRVVVFEGGYHGGVLTFGAAGRAVNVPHRWELCRFNDLDDVRATFERCGDEIACVLVEPMQGSAGCIPGEREFLVALRDLCDGAGALLVFDEVMTSRLAPGGGQSLAGVVPDLTTLGKYLGGGFSFGAFGGRGDLMAAFDPHDGGELGHAGTFNNNVVTMAAGIAAAELLTPDVLAAVNGRGERLRSSMAEVFAAHRLPMSVTGQGSLMNVHATPGPVRSTADLATSDGRWRELFFFDALEAGFFVAPRGFIALSIEIDDADVERFVGHVDQWASTVAARAG